MRIIIESTEFSSAYQEMRHAGGILREQIAHPEMTLRVRHVDPKLVHHLVELLNEIGSNPTLLSEAIQRIEKLVGRCQHCGSKPCRPIGM